MHLDWKKKDVKAIDKTLPGFPFERQSKGGTKKSSDLPKVTEKAYLFIGVFPETLVCSHTTVFPQSYYQKERAEEEVGRMIQRNSQGNLIPEEGG